MPCVLRDWGRPQFTKMERLVLLLEALVRGKGTERVESSAGAMKCGEISPLQYSYLKLRMILLGTLLPAPDADPSITPYVAS